MEKSISYVADNIGEVYEEYVVMAEYKTAESEYQICKYCGEKEPNKFKSKAHLLPEFTGNKEWFCYNECDNCNNKFGVYEYNLKNFGAFKNSHLPISGKKKFPKYVDGNNNFVAQFKNENTLIMNTKGNNDFFKIVDDKIKIESITMPFVPLYVYKSFVKFAFSLMEKKDYEQFCSGISWLNNPKSIVEPIIPNMMLYYPNGKPVIKPIAILLKRKKDYNCPEFSFVFIWGFLTFQIFLPFNSKDETLDYSNIQLPILSEFITKTSDGKFGVSHFDMNSLTRIQSLEKISFGFRQK
jgi:hypothetical protein